MATQGGVQLPESDSAAPADKPRATLAPEGYDCFLALAATLLLAAGFFTFPFGRLLGSWLFG